MSSKKIAIVCEGKEISYGINFLHLFQYRSEKEKFNSDMLDDLSIEIYSSSAFRHTNISKKTIKVFVGNAQHQDSAYRSIFNKFGMAIYQLQSDYIMKADDKQLANYEYEDFILYANVKRKEYFDLEKRYTDRVELLDSNWITKKFEKASSSGFLGKKSVKVQQQYDCLAFVLYLDFFKNEEV